MRDSRVTVFNTTTVDSTTAVDGPSINLLDGRVGTTLYGTSLYGLGVEVILKNVRGPGARTLDVWWQRSQDGTTWEDFIHVGRFQIDSSGQLLKEDGSTPLGLDRAKLSTRLVTAMGKYARLRLVPSGTWDSVGPNDAVVDAYISDGTLPYADTGKIL